MTLKRWVVDFLQWVRCKCVIGKRTGQLRRSRTNDFKRIELMFNGNRKLCFAPYRNCLHRISQNPERMPRYRKYKSYTVATYKLCSSKRFKSVPLEHTRVVLYKLSTMQCTSTNSRSRSVRDMSHRRLLSTAL